MPPCFSSQENVNLVESLLISLSGLVFNYVTSIRHHLKENHLWKRDLNP